MVDEANEDFWHDGDEEAEGRQLKTILAVGAVIVAAAVAAGVARRRRNRSQGLRRLSDYAPDLRSADLQRAVRALSDQAERISDRLADVAPSRRDASRWGRQMVETSEREWDRLSTAAAPTLERIAVRANDFVRAALRKA